MPSNQRSGTAFSGNPSGVLGRVNLTGSFVREMASHVRQNKLTAGERDMTARLLEAIAGSASASGGAGTGSGSRTTTAAQSRTR